MQVLDISIRGKILYQRNRVIQVADGIRGGDLLGLLPFLSEKFLDTRFHHGIPYTDHVLPIIVVISGSAVESNVILQMAAADDDNYLMPHPMNCLN